jgi:hypothetical protein
MNTKTSTIIVGSNVTYQRIQDGGSRHTENATIIAASVLSDLDKG